jgi:uncharacterized RDD family membrane protein YckC
MREFLGCKLMKDDALAQGVNLKMSCPQCQSTEIGSSGKCKVCGYQIQAPDSAPVLEPEVKESGKQAGMIAMNYSESAQDSPSKAEIPQWRKDLSQRLQEIRKKRDVAGAAVKESPANSRPSPASEFQARPAAVPIRPSAKSNERTPARKPAIKPSRPTPHQKILKPLAPEAIPSKQASQPANPREIQRLIDSVVSRQSPAADKPARPAEIYGAVQELESDDEGKWIFLSRTLSGLIDLICVIFCTGIFILAADFISGIIVLDFFSLVHFAALLLLTYFVYSFFFLFASNQTIGMMITDLRVAGIHEPRPSFARLGIRCCCYIISLLAFGIGLIWGLFNRGNLCLHDRLSGTTVVRI